MSAATSGLSSEEQNLAQCGRRVMQISMLKQDKCSGNRVKHIFAMKAVHLLPGLAGMVSVEPRGALLLGRQWVAFAAAMPCMSSATARGKLGNVGQAWITNTGTDGFLADLWSLGVFGKIDGFTGFVNLSLTFHPLGKQNNLHLTPMALQGGPAWNLLYG